MTNSRAKVIGHDWVFVDYNAPDFVRNLPLFISRVLAVSKNGRQFITWFDHEIDKWDLEGEELDKDDYIMAWTQVEYPKLAEDI
jgi:hypothetical protein